MKISRKINGKRISSISVILILIGVISISSSEVSMRPLFAKGIADYSAGTPPSDTETDKKKEEERKVEAGKRAIQDQQAAQRLEKEKQDQKQKDEERKKAEERRELERLEREAQEARIREEQEREAQRKREEAAQIAEQQRQEQDRLYREDQQRREQIRQEQDRANQEQQNRADQDERNRIANEEQWRQDQEARDAQDEQNQINNQPNDRNDNSQSGDQNQFLNSSESERDTSDSGDGEQWEPDTAFYSHYKDPFFYPYDLYSFAHFSFDNSDYVISPSRPSRRIPSSIRKGSANEVIYDVSYAWKYKSPEHLIKHTTRRSLVNIFNNARYSHTLTQKQLYELTNEALLNINTYGMKFSSIKAKPAALSFKLMHEFYTSDMKARQVSLKYFLKKINGVWLIQKIDIIRNRK